MAIIVPDVLPDNRYVRVVARGARTTNSPTSVNGAEQRSLGLNAIPVLSGRTYRITVGGFLFSSTAANDFGVANIRYTTDGSIPTTTSTKLTAHAIPTLIANGGYNVTFTTLYIPGASGTFRPTLTLSGSASATLTLIATAAQPGFIYVEDLAADPGNTATVY